MTTPTQARPPRTTGPRREWPRPQLIHDHAALFQEPVYEGGQPYTDDDDLEDDEPAIITA